VPVFVKRIPLTDLERDQDNVMSTARVTAKSVRAGQSSRCLRTRWFLPAL
jgi:hypothetical protein